MQRSTSRDLFELLGSMRFATSLLTVLAVASIIGTLIEPDAPFNACLKQFGPLRFPVIEQIGLYAVYNAGLVLVVLAFLAVTTFAFISVNMFLSGLHSYGSL